MNSISKNNESKEELNVAAKGGTPCPPGYVKLNGRCVEYGTAIRKTKPAKKVEPYVTSDPEEYAYRKAAYDDSLWLYKNNLRTPPLLQPNRQKYNKSDSWLNKLAKWSVDEKVIDRKNLTLTPEEFKKGLKTTWYQSGLARFINPVGESKKLNDLYTTNESDKYKQSPIRNSNLPKNEPIKYVGNMMRSKNNTGESGQRISQFEPRYKKPVQPVIFKEPVIHQEKKKPVEHKYPTSYKPVIDNTHQKPPEGKLMVGQEEVQQLDPNTGQVTTVINPIYEDAMMPMQTLHPTRVDNTLRKFVGPPSEIPEEEVIEDTEDTTYTEDSGEPEPGGHWEQGNHMYIDWKGNQGKVKTPKFRKPGHSGPLLKGTNTHYFRYPSIERRHDIWVEPDEEYATGGEYNIGDEVELTEAEVKRLRALGYTIEEA